MKKSQIKTIRLLDNMGNTTLSFFFLAAILAGCADTSYSDFSFSSSDPKNTDNGTAGEVDSETDSALGVGDGGSFEHGDTQHFEDSESGSKAEETDDTPYPTDDPEGTDPSSNTDLPDSTDDPNDSELPIDTDDPKETDESSDSESVKIPSDCGDGVLTSDEACDDKNREDGDGCAGNCLSVDPGFSCNPPGELCHPIAKCGDGVVIFPEQCDDKNTASDDGCSAVCKVEIGFKCDGDPSVCSLTTCGDGKVEGAESCDDGNDYPFDGCSPTCQAEPECSGSSCVSECGDGLVLNEACDDGNTLDGDGCSAECEVEAGYKCSNETECEQVSGECVQRIFAVFRDFKSYQDPYSEFSGGGDMIKGLVEDSLNDLGKPVAVPDVNTVSNGSIASPESFARWYTDTDDSETKVGSLVLFDDGAEGFVNRWGEAGEQWCIDSICYDGTPAFFPVDDLSDGSDFAEATIPEEYGGNWYPESTWVPDAVPHNFGFTTEVKYWFYYDESQTATLSFLGDDDVWVFVNGRLALDLGNLHMPKEGTVTISAATAGDYDLVDGSVYGIQVFHAERNPTGSSFKLTLTGFEASRSLCLPTCGDGIVGMGEECDDGENDGGYGECDEGCVLGEYCGDGIVQENEDCDDGNTLDGDECGSSCRNLIII